MSQMIATDPPPHRTPAVRALRALCQLLNVSFERVLRRADMAPDALESTDRPMGAADMFAVWRGLEAEAAPTDLALSLAPRLARAPIHSALLAFSCSPNVETGLRRLALFKPMLGPVRLAVKRGEAALVVRKHVTDPEVLVPPSFAAFEMVYLLEMIRAATVHHVVPRAVTLPAARVDAPVRSRTGPHTGSHTSTHAERGGDALAAHFGCRVRGGAGMEMQLALTDADRPLISADEALWQEFEPDLRRALRENGGSRAAEEPAMADRVRRVLMDLLPAGDATADRVAARMRLSKRSLQRHLQAEGVSFREILDTLRRDLALTYLRRPDLHVDEIALLLGYRDPTSFYRAFHGWTGMTPALARRAAR